MTGGIIIIIQIAHQKEEKIIMEKIIKIAQGRKIKI
jgi:hypothetical protein